MIGSGMPISQRRAPLPKPIWNLLRQPYLNNGMSAKRFHLSERATPARAD